MVIIQNGIKENIMKNEVTVVTASSAEFFHFAVGTILSIREKPQGRSVDISLFDLGLTDEQKEWLKGQVDNIVKPEWEFGFTDNDGFAYPFKGILARPRIRQYFPGYEVYMQLDGDAWVQDWDAVETYVKGARTSAIAVTPEIHRAYTNNYTSSAGFRQLIVTIMTDCRDDSYAKKYRDWPIINTGVFAMRKDSPLWDMWADEIQITLKKAKHHTLEQASLNIAIFDHFEEFDRKNIQFLPAEYNWLCHQCLPVYDTQHDVFVEPYLPCTRLKVIHRSSDDFKKQKTGHIMTTNGETREMNLKYREGNYNIGIKTEEPHLSGWQAPTWVG